MKRFMLALAASAAAIAVATPASAAIFIGVSVNGGPITQVATDGGSGSVNYNTTTGGYFYNIGATGSPILNQPQVAMLGTGAIVRRPVVIDADGAETIAIRSMMYLALTYDHRIVDGADAARFLSTVKERLEEGRFEASLGL